MDRQLAEELISHFPFLRPTRGIECGPGWFDVIRDLCEKITKLDPRANYQIVKVGRSFGTLLIGDFYPTLPIQEAIYEAGRVSQRTCEFCGKPGCIRVKHDWRYAMCESCFDVGGRR